MNAKQIIENAKKMPWDRLYGVLLVTLPFILRPNPGMEVPFWMAMGALFVLGLLRIMRA